MPPKPGRFASLHAIGVTFPPIAHHTICIYVTGTLTAEELEVSVDASLVKRNISR
jgi:hypothetical protein